MTVHLLLLFGALSLTSSTATARLIPKQPRGQALARLLKRAPSTVKVPGTRTVKRGMRGKRSRKAGRQINVAGKSFRHDPQLGQDVEVVAVVKLAQRDEELLRHRAAVIADRKAGRPPTSRLSKVYPGFVARLTLKGDSVRYDKAAWRFDGAAPRGYAKNKRYRAVAYHDHVVIYDRSTGKEVRRLEGPEYRTLHEVSFHPKRPNVLLVTSTGFDSLMEVDIQSNKVLWSWNSWRQGFNRNAIGMRLFDSRHPVPADFKGRMVDHAEAQALFKAGKPLPADQELGVVVDFHAASAGGRALPKWLRTVQPNWSVYGKKGDVIYASFFQQGRIVRIDRSRGRVETVLDGLKMPHGLIPYRNGYVVSDTGHGKVHQLSRKFRLKRTFDFSDLPVPAEDHSSPGGFRDNGQEWIQFTYPVGNGKQLATVDSRRAKLYVWNPKRKRINTFDLPNDSEVQAVKPTW